MSLCIILSGQYYLNYSALFVIAAYIACLRVPVCSMFLFIHHAIVLINTSLLVQLRKPSVLKFSLALSCCILDNTIAIIIWSFLCHSWLQFLLAGPCFAEVSVHLWASDMVFITAWFSLQLWRPPELSFLEHCYVSGHYHSQLLDFLSHSWLHFLPPQMHTQVLSSLHDSITLSAAFVSNVYMNQMYIQLPDNYMTWRHWVDY